MKRLLTTLGCLALALAPGCGIHMAEHYAGLRPALAAHDGARALAYIERTKKSFYGDRNQLLYLMDRAMVLFDAGDMAACQQSLDAAKALSQKLWTRSVGAEAEAWLSTDNALPYQGEDFEKVFLYILAACSYMQAQNLDDARVEVRQVSQTLALLQRSHSDAPSLYRDDALAHWLGGLLYEAESSNLARLSDARIEYARALALYEAVDQPHYGTPVPRQLVRALARIYAALGPDAAQALAALRRRYGAAAAPDPAPTSLLAAAGRARLVVVVLAGEAPIKLQEEWQSVLGPNVYRVAYPVFAKRQQAYRPPVVVVNGQAIAAKPELGMDLEGVALRNLADHMGRIKDRVMRRAVLKYTAGTVAEGVGLARGGVAGFGTFLAGLALNTATAATEEADTRSWATLPARVYVTETWIPAGPVQVAVGARTQATLTARGGDTLFVTARTLM